MSLHTARIGVSFFFCCYVFHRRLHSFPTRRSSDLAAMIPSNPSCCTSSPSCPDSCRSTTVRSEEHTSELQSQSNLVCSLLLVKKKTNPIYQGESVPPTSNTTTQVTSPG